MKKTTLLKTLLMAVCLLTGTSAWAESATVTLDHTAGAQWGSNTGASTVDAEKEHYNNDRGDAWAGCAYAKFSYTVPDGATITSATLTYYVNQGGNYSRDDKIYYMSKDFDLEWASFAGQTGTDLRYTSNRGGTAVAAATTGGKGERGPLAQDVTAAVSAIYAAGQNYIIFQWTGNAGGADLYGKGSATKAPVLSITYTNETRYTATFTETNSLNPTVTIYSNEGRTSEVTNGTLVDKTTYYYRAVKHGYVNYEGSFTVNGADPSVSFTMTAAEKVTSLSVYAKISGANHLIKTIDLDDKYVGDQVSFTYPRFYKISTTLYIVSDDHYNTHGGYYKWNNYTLDGSSVVLDYNGGTIENVVYYSEGENIADMTADSNNNGDIRCSGGQGGRSSEELSLTSLGAGQYKLTSRVWGNTGVSYTYKAAGGEILVHALTGALNDKTVSFNVVSGTATITVQGSGSANGKVLDYVYIQKTDDDETLIYNGDFENSTWDAVWSGTGTNKANAFAKQTSSQSWGATGNFAEMWTDAEHLYAVEANLRQILINVPAGSYTLSADILNNVSSSGGVLYAKVGSADDVTTAAENASGANASVSFNVAATSNVVVGFKTTALNGKSGWIAVDNFEVEQTAVSVTVSDAGFATYVPSYDLNFTGKEIEAYKVKVSTKGVAALTKVDNVPAGTPVLLYKDGGATENIPVMTGAAAVTGNDLVAGTGIAVPTSDGAGNTNMILNNGASGIGFYFAAGQTVAKNRAYLHIDSDLAPDAVGGSRMVMVFADDETTGVHSIDNGKLTIDNDVYDLQGRRVAQPTKGLYIVNGKKVVIK